MEQKGFPGLNKDLLRTDALNPFINKAHQLAIANKANDKNYRTIDAFLKVAETPEERAVANLAEQLMEQAKKRNEKLTSDLALLQAVAQLRETL